MDNIDIGKYIVWGDFFNNAEEAHQWLTKLNTDIEKISKAKFDIQGINGIKSLNETVSQLNAANKTLADSIKTVTAARAKEVDVNLKASKAQTELAKQSTEAAKAKQLEAKASVDNAKAKELEQKYTAALTKEKEKLEVQSGKEQKNLEKLNNAYEQLKAKYTIAANTAKQLAAEELKVVAAEGEKSKAAQQAARFTQDAQKAAGAYYEQLVKIERAVGQSQRTVGQYERATFALSQVIREAPAFMYSFQTGLLGISNNIPLLIEEYDKLKTSTGSTSTALGVLAKSLFSPINLISLGIAILPALITKVGEWTGISKSAAQTQKELAERAQSFNDALKNQIDLLGSGIYGAKTFDIRIKAMKDELSLMEKQGTDQVTLFAKRKQIAEGEKQLALTKANQLASEYAVNKEQVADAKKTYDLLLQVQGNYIIGVNSLSEQLKNTSLSKDQVESLKAQLSTAKGGLDLVTSTINEVNRVTKDGNDLQSEEAKFNADERRKLVLETTRIEVDNIKSKNDFILNNEKSTLDQRLAALRSNQAAQRQLIQAEKNNVLSNPESSAADRTIAIKKAASDEFQLTQETNRAVFDLKEEFRKRDLDAQKQYYVQHKQLEIEQLNDIKGNTEVSLNDRLIASQKIFDAQKAILDKEYETKKQSVQNTFLTDEEKLAIEKDYESKLLSLSRETNEQVTAILKAEIDKQSQLRQEDITRIKSLYDSINLSGSSRYTEDVIALNDSLKLQEISYSQYLKKRKELDNDYKIFSLQTTIDLLKSELSQFTSAADVLTTTENNLKNLREQLSKTTNTDDRQKLLQKIDVAKQEYEVAKKLNDQKIDLEKQLNDASKQLSDDTLKHDLDNQEKRKQAAETVLNTTSDFISKLKSFGDTLSGNKIQEYEAQKTALEDRYLREQDLINQTYTNQIDRDRALKEAEARHAAQKTQLDKKEKEEKRRQAIRDKEAAVLSIIVNTAAAVVKALPNIPLAIATGALGALELVTALSAKIPTFFKGKNTESLNNYEGLAVVDEGRNGKGNAPETILREDGTIEKGGNKPRLTFLKAQDIVIPYGKEHLVADAMAKTNTAAQSFVSVVNVDNGLRKEDYLQGVNRITKAIKNQKQPKLYMPSLMDLWINSGKTWNEFNNNFRA